MRKHIPNILTISRVVLVLPIICLVAIPTPTAYSIDLSSIDVGTINISIGFVVAMVLFLVCSITDYFDGFLARRWNVVSDIGKLWDPIADKLLINTLMIAFAALNYVHFGIVICFIARDIIMDGLRMYALRYNIVVDANIYGKLKTVTQMIACFLTLIISGLPLTSASSTANGLLWFWIGQMFFYWVALIFSFYSGFVYYFKVIKFVKIKRDASLSDAN